MIGQKNRVTVPYEEFLKNPRKYLLSEESYWWVLIDSNYMGKNIKILKLQLDSAGKFIVADVIYTSKEDVFPYEDAYYTHFHKEELLEHKNFQFLKEKEGQIGNGNECPI